MKFLCPNCKAKYRIGSEKLVGRQAAKIRCRKCDYRIQIAYRPGSDEYEVTATPASIAPAAPAPRAAKAVQPTAGGPAVMAPRTRPVPGKDESAGTRKPTAAVPGLPGLGSPKSTRGAALHTEDAAPLAPGAPGRRPLAPPPPGQPASPQGGSALGVASTGNGPPPALSMNTALPVGLPLPPVPIPPMGVPPAVAPTPARPPGVGNQLADQFRQSVQAGVAEELPQDGWFVGVNGVPLGPIPVGDLRELASAGHIDRRSLVWREGLAEWRPLGKFPQLARVLDDGGGAQHAPEPENASGTTRPNGMNGHAASGFEAARSTAAEAGRPSAWGDLDDEDDEDEQPTTVKGRVSVSPVDANAPPPSAQPSRSRAAADAAVAPPPAADAAGPPPPPPFEVPIPSAGTDFRAPQAVFAPSASTEIGQSSITTPDPVADDVDARMMRPRGRGRIYLILLAVVAAFALGALITRSVEPTRSKEPKGPSPEPARALAPAPEATPPSKAEELAAPEAETDGMVDEGPAPKAGPDPGNKPSSGGPGVPDQAPAQSGSSLVLALGGLQPPGPMAEAREGPEGPSGGAGLDATAIQRTVRRYTPAVRQNCWLRALNTRAAGVPSSAKVTAAITVDAAGRVQSVSVSGAPKGYPGLARCIEGSVKGWQFPRAGAPTEAQVPFMFVGQ